MSSIIPPRPRVHSASKFHVAIVASKFNEEFTDALVANAVAELQGMVDNPRIDIVRVPGAFEIPVMVRSVFEEDEPQCVIALGCIIQGATAHADLIARAVTDQLCALSVSYAKPVIHEVLLVENEKQAYARCIGETLNRGKEAARSALECVGVMNEITRANQSIRLHPSNA